MNLNTAHEILGTKSGQSLLEIKKAYRIKIRQVHPDEQIHGASEYEYSAMDVNVAYETIVKNGVFADIKERTRKGKASWNAPENLNAYCEREIFHNAENECGEAYGVISVGFGKYIWCEDEDFSLFMKSIMACTKSLLDRVDASLNREIDDVTRLSYQAELSYLLATQFIDSRQILSKYSKIESTDGDVFYSLNAMLEINQGLSIADAHKIRHGQEALLPAYLKNHRLYFKNNKGSILGYLSLKDDRLYYAVIPLFEQRTVQMKVNVENTEAYTSKKTDRRYNKYIPLKLTLRFVADIDVFAIESININIENLMEKYKKL